MSRLPNVTPKQMVAALRKAGFIEHHQKGSHLYLWHPTRRKMTTVSMHAKDLKRGLLKEMLRQADLTEDAFRQLL